MPLPRFIARINRRVFNPREVKGGERPAITHIGRASGRTFRTPLDAHPIEGGYVFFLMYGSRSDWAKNVLAAGTARLAVEGREIELSHPRVVAWDDVRDLLPAGTKPTRSRRARMKRAATFTTLTGRRPIGRNSKPKHPAG